MCVWFAGISSPFLNRYGYTVVAVAAGLVVLGVLAGRWLGVRLLELRPLRALGRISYGLYLWHLPTSGPSSARASSGGGSGASPSA